MPTLSDLAKQSINAAQTGEVWLILLTISHAAISPSIRVVNNNEDIVSRGNTFLAFPFELALPQESGEQLTTIGLQIDNVDRQIVAALRAITTAPTVEVEVILADYPDTVEIGPYTMSMVEASYNALTVSGVLVLEDILNRLIPSESFDPTLYPSLF